MDSTVHSRRTQLTNRRIRRSTFERSELPIPKVDFLSELFLVTVLFVIFSFPLRSRNVTSDLGADDKMMAGIDA